MNHYKDFIPPRSIWACVTATFMLSCSEGHEREDPRNCSCSEVFYGSPTVTGLSEDETADVVDALAAPAIILCSSTTSPSVIDVFPGSVHSIKRRGPQ